MDRIEDEHRNINELNGYSYRYVLSLPRVEPMEAYMLYHKNYWDFPLSGVCSFGGKRYFFRIAIEVSERMIDSFMDSYESVSEIIYVLEDLSEEDWEIEDEVHAKFTKYVGCHTEYDSDGKRAIGKVNEEAKEHKKFYDWHAGLDPSKKNLKGEPKFRIHAGNWSYGIEPEENYKDSD